MPDMAMKSLAFSALVFPLTVGAAASADSADAPVLELPVDCGPLGQSARPR